MSLWLMIPVVLGFTVVLQGALNRRIGGSWGIPSAVLLNAVVFLSLSFLFFLLGKSGHSILPDFMKSSGHNQESLAWWYLLPGTCGFLLVFGVPVSLQQIGATKTFLLLIVSQVFFSLVLEKIMTGEMPSQMKMAGAVVALLGAALVALG